MMEKYKEIEMPLYDAFIYLLDIGIEDEVFEAIETIVDDLACHEDIYRLAKRYYVANRPLSIKLINTIAYNVKYFNGFRAYTECINQNEEGLDNMINYKKIVYKAEILDNLEAHIEDLNEIVFSIVEYYPSKAMDLLEEIDKISAVMNEKIIIEEYSYEGSS